MIKSKFIPWIKYSAEKISLLHVIILSCLFAFIAILFNQGIGVNPEMNIRLPYYLSDVPLLNKLFDSNVLDEGFYRARELSYFLDFIDCKFVEFSIEKGFPHFLSLTHWLFSIIIGCVLWLFCVKELNLGPFIGTGWLALFWTTPSIIFGGYVYRSGKIGTALLAAILSYLIYKAATLSIEKTDFQLSKKSWFLYVLSIFSITLLDEQGLFLAMIVVVFLAIWGSFVRHKNIYILLMIGIASLLFNGLYRYAIAPHLTCALNGYWPDFFYWRLPFRYFFNNLGFHLSSGFMLYVDSFRYLIGNPPRMIALLLLWGVVSLPLYYVLISPGVSDIKRRYLILVFAELLVINVLMVVMISLMVLRKADIMLPFNSRVYYWPPTIVVLSITLLILIRALDRSKTSAMIISVMICCAIAGNIVAIPGHWDSFAGKNIDRINQMRSQELLDALKNINSTKENPNTFIEQNPVYQFFKNKMRNQASRNWRLLEFDTAGKPCIKPDRADSFNKMGIFYARRKEYRLAIEYFGEAIHERAVFVEAYSNRGLAYSRLGNYQAALEDFNRAIGLKPDFTDAYIDRGIVYLLQGKKEDGCFDAKKACALGNCRLLDMAKDKKFCLRY